MCPTCLTASVSAGSATWLVTAQGRRVVPTVRAFAFADLDASIGVALRAWEPVHASMATVLGEQVNARVYPDWNVSQAESVRRACTDPEVLTSVAAEGAEVLGFVCVVLRPAEGTGEIGLIAVDPAAQRRGVGAALLKHAVMQIRDAGCSLVEVATGGDPGHAPARVLYEKAGFTALPLVRYYRVL